METQQEADLRKFNYATNDAIGKNLLHQRLMNELIAEFDLRSFTWEN